MSARHFAQPFKKKTFTPIFMMLFKYRNEYNHISLTTKCAEQDEIYAMQFSILS